MLQFICGRSGSGKTEYVLNQICKNAENKDIVFLVPEQSSFQNEKRILKILGAKKAAKITVLSFSRLCDILIKKYAAISKKRIDEGEKIVLMSLAIEEVSDKLTLYGNRSKKSDLAELMMSGIDEYKMCALSEQDLLNALPKIENDRLKEKIKESVLIYSAYNALVDKAYSDPSDDLTKAYEILLFNPYFQGKTVYIDSFNGYSGQEMRVLECILNQAETVTITLGCDTNEGFFNQNSIFSESNETYRQLTKIAEKNNIPQLVNIELDSQKRFKYPSLSYIEESIYRYDGDEYEITDNAVQMYEAEDEYDEIEQTARDISELVLNNDYSYNEISVICRKSETYKSIIESEFSKFNIPYFLSNPQPLEEKPLVKLILSAFDVIHSSFNTESLLLFLKTDLTSLTYNEVCKLENYAYIWDIRGKRWKSEFTMNPNGNSEEVDQNALDKIEELRKKAITPIVDFSNELSKSKNGGEISIAVYKLLEKMGTSNKIRTLSAYFNHHNDIKEKEDESRVWDIVMNILDKMYNALKDIYIDTRRYAELLKLMISHNSISDIPQTLDQVTIGTAGNIRTENPRAVFVIGAVEGVFPSYPTSGGIFSENERCELINAELPIYDNLYKASLKEKFNVYAALSAPSEKLFISRYKINSSGENCLPSSIFREVSAIINNIHIRNNSELLYKEKYYTEKQTFSYCAELWNEKNSHSDTLKQYYSSTENYASLIASINRAVTEEPIRVKNHENIKKMFGEMNLSASQIESYHLCPFAYFCKYGIKAYPRKKAVMDSGLYGSVVHFVLENILKEYDFESFKLLNDEQLSLLTQKYVEQYINSIGGEKEHTKRFVSSCKRMEKNIILVLKHLIAEFENSKFKPADFELKIGGEKMDIPPYELHLPNGEKVSICGRIDRVDTFTNTKNEKYIRIVDYKTGNKIFKLSDVLYGLNIQMLLYLSALSKNGQKHYSENGEQQIFPAGVLYMPSTPTSKIGDFDNEKQREKLIGEQNTSMKMNGLLIDDKDIISAMEDGIKGIFIPAKIKNDGDFDKRYSNIASLAEFGKIFSIIDKKIISMAQSLYDGKVDVLPAKMKTDACAYCDYKIVCGYEEGKKVNNIKNLSLNDTLELISKEEETNE